MSRPSKVMRPAVSGINRSSRRARVDLPQPLSPTMPSAAPRSSVRSRSATARTLGAAWNRRRRPSKLRDSPSARSSGSVMARRGGTRRCVPAAARARSGFSCRQRIVARGQRGWNRQPAGGVIKPGMLNRRYPAGGVPDGRGPAPRRSAPAHKGAAGGPAARRSVLPRQPCRHTSPRRARRMRR